MKYFKMILSLLAVVLMFTSCQEDDLDLDTITVPTNIVIDTQISDDGSGLVIFNVSADNAFSYKFNFGDGSSVTSLDGTASKRFTRTGLNTYLVTVVAYGKGAVSSSKSIEIEVESDFNDPETKQFLTGGSSKTWYIASALPGHLAVGPNDGEGEGLVNTSFFSAAPNSLQECFYDDEMTFSLDANENIQYDYDNKGVTFFNWQYTLQFGGSGEQFVDECLDFTPATPVSVTLGPATSGIPENLSTGTVMEFNNDAFVSYYIGSSTYEILEIDENNMYLRTVQGNDDFLAWYLKLTTSPGGGGSGGETGEEFETQFTELFFTDEFDGEALDTSVWNYEIGNGTDGWGNGEVQYYTSDEENVKVQDGNLIITAKREPESGFDFTSGRITTQDNFEFTYGRIEARAKLPAGGGTWPAIWMLGANFDVVGWPETGEIDIMEWVGNEPTRVSSALHFPENFGGNAVVGATTIENAASEFHIYEAEWTSEKITFLLDGEVFFTFDNDPSKPFDKDFFLIMNVAMGGGFGGAIDPNFQEASMEVDYIRVYQ